MPYNFRDPETITIKVVDVPLWQLIAEICARNDLKWMLDEPNRTLIIFHCGDRVYPHIGGGS